MHPFQFFFILAIAVGLYQIPSMKKWAPWVGILALGALFGGLDILFHRH